MKPGSRYAPRPSMTASGMALSSALARPTRAIRPSSTSTSAGPNAGVALPRTTMTSLMSSRAGLTPWRGAGREAGASCATGARSAAQRMLSTGDDLGSVLRERLLDHLAERWHFRPARVLLGAQTRPDHLAVLADQHG